MWYSAIGWELLKSLQYWDQYILDNFAWMCEDELIIIFYDDAEIVLANSNIQNQVAYLIDQTVNWAQATIKQTFKKIS